MRFRGEEEKWKIGRERKIEKNKIMLCIGDRKQRKGRKNYRRKRRRRDEERVEGRRVGEGKVFKGKRRS